MPAPPPSTVTLRRTRHAWWLLAGALLALLAFVVWSRASAWRQVDEQERARLVVQARGLEQNLARQLQGAAAALRHVRDWVPEWQGAELAETGSRRLEALADAMPGVRTLSVLDADGTVLASNRRELIGRSFAEREYYRVVRERNDAGLLHLSPPFRTSLGVFSMNLALAVPAPGGGFGGVVAATLDPDYFQVAMQAALYAPDMWVAVAHGGGRLMMCEPPNDAFVGRDLDQPGSFFRRHRDSGEHATLLTGPTLVDGIERMLAQRNVQPAGLGLDAPVVVAVGRRIDAIFAPWREQTSVYAALYLLFAAVSSGGLLVGQRRAAAAERLAVAQEEARRRAAERTALALRGGDLGLWDLDLRSNVSTVDDRWCEMLGIAPFGADPGGMQWRSRVHPDEVERVVAAQEAHVAGRAPRFDEVYRMRHADGRWIWIHDRGQVLERDGEGRPLRMLGTHQDISERMQAQQALAESEESLAITLQSIGDAVIATDAEGRITRLNAAAQRLTGWAPDEALGRPLGEVFRIFAARTREPAVDPVRQVLEHGQVVALANDTLLVARDGRELQIADSAAPIRARSGEVVGVVLVFSDVTERYRAAQALRDRERQLSAITAALPGPVSRVDREGRYLFANAAYERWFGLRPEQVVGRLQTEVLGEYYARVEPYVRRALAGETVTYDGPVPGAPGGPLHALVTLVPDVAADGEVVGHFTVVTDITARKRADDARAASERRLRLLLDHIGAGVIVHGADTQIVDANPAACALTGLTLDQMRGKVSIDPYWAFLEEDGTVMAHERFPVPQVLASGVPLTNFVLGLRRPDRPRPLWALCNAYPLRDARGRIEQVFVTFVDITERKEAGEQLRLLGSAVEQLNDVVLITEAEPLDMPGPRIVFVNAAFERLTGWTRAEAIGRTPRITQGPQTDAAELRRIGGKLRRGEPLHSELLNYARDGNPYWIELDVMPLVDRSGRVTHFVSVQRDITERRRAQQQLLAARSDLQATLEAIPDLLFEIGADGVVHRVHSPRTELLLLPPEQQLGRRFDDVAPPDAAAVIRSALQQAEATGSSSGLQYELVLAGVRRWFELSVSRRPQLEGGEVRYIVLSRDVTERKQAEFERQALERQLREAQRMESIGTLAGGIAHDFNNIIAAILGNVALAREDAGANAAVQQSLAQINRAGLRARHVVQQILSFSRHEQQPLVLQPLAPVVDETVGLLRATMPAGVRLEAVIEAAPVFARVDATQLQQVLMNLCTNAWHALPAAGGRIEVGLARVPLDDALRQRLPELHAPRLAHLWVRDNGCGMDAATRERIFDPFFTTKPVGKGTGLGLAVVHTIVREHEGAITVDTAPGQGSTFHLYLPSPEAAPDGAAEAAAAGAAAPALAQGGGRHVLYVDDDEVMVLMVERLLERAGFRVTTEIDAEAAIERVRAAPQAFDAVVTDFNMPAMSGVALARRLLALRVDLPVVLSTGYLSEELRADAAAAGVRALMKKENTIEELSGLLQSLFRPGAPAAGSA